MSSLSLNQLALEKRAFFALRPELFWIDACELEATNLTNKGATVQFQFNTDLPVASSPISETTDITVATMADTTQQIVLAEYGNAVQTTAKARATAYLELNPIVADVIGYNAGVSIDTVAQTAFQIGTQVVLSGGVANRNLLTTSGTTSLKGTDVARARAKLMGQAVKTFNGTYRGFVHPDVAYDFKNTTGAYSWSDPHTYSDPAGIWNGVIGTFQGVMWLETPRGPLFADVGNGAGSAGTVDAYRTIILGREAVGCGYSNGGGYSGGKMPTYVQTPEIDLLKRFDGTGWKWFGGVKILRQTAIYAIESSSTIGTN
jgi:N4-gp56 family major capsid protein